MLLFRSEETVEKWCATHQLPKRPLINIDQIWALANEWYANRLTVESRRPKPNEMAKIFERIGLTESFWDPKSDKF